MKQYLRGFGVGVLFVTVLFVLIRKPEALTDAEVESRAVRLGMLTGQEAEEKRLSAIRETELKWKDELEKQKQEYETLLKQKGSGDAEAEDGGNGTEPGKDGEDGVTSGDGEGTSGNEDSGNDETGTAQGNDSTSGNDGNSGTDGTGTAQGNDSTSGNEGSGNDGTGAAQGNAGTSGNNGTDGTSSEQDGTGTASGDGTPGLVKIEVVEGMSANEVAYLLEEAGVIESAADFRQAIWEQNRQKLIQVGTFELRQGEEMQKIVDKLTGR